MIRTSLRRSLLALTAALFVLPVASEGSAQVITGVLRDKDAGLPIAGAVVLLLDAEQNQRLRVQTDARGRFTLRAPEPGRYSLWAEREGYASTVSPILSVPLAQTVEADLTIGVLRTDGSEAGVVAGESYEDLDPYEAAARYAAMLAQACEGLFDPERHAILVGTVRDEQSNVVLPGVEATIEWEGVPDSTARVRVDFDPGTGAPRTFNQISGRTDDDGAFMICNAPTETSLAMWAQAGEEARGVTRVVRLNPGTMKKEDLLLSLTTQTQPGDILGTVRDRAKGDPISGAEVVIEGTEYRTITNARGVFTFEDVPWGIYVLGVNHLAFADVEQAFRVQGGQAHQVEVLMTEEAIELDPLTVSVRPRAWFTGMQGLQHRINMGFGYILDQEDLEFRGVSNIDDALRGIPGVRIVPTGAYGTMVQFRGSRNMLGAACTPSVWMDGQEISLDPELGLNEFNALDLQAIEVYRSTAEIPGEFGGMNSACGALVMWTKRGYGR